MRSAPETGNHHRTQLRGFFASTRHSLTKGDAMNEKFAHTPGPWKVEKELSSRLAEWLITMDAGDRGRGIAIAETVPATGRELANAHLIAAAPTMYEYILSSASNGCAEAQKILEAIHARR